MRSGVAQATQAGSDVSAAGGQLFNQAMGAYGPLGNAIRPIEQSGVSPQQLANLQTGAQQESGGALSGIQGGADLQAMRSRNAGGFGMALDEAARQKMRQDTASNLGIQQYALGRQMQGLQLGADLYGTQLSNAMKAYGLIPEDVQAAAEANRTGWFQNMTGLIGALGGAAGGAGALGVKV